MPVKKMAAKQTYKDIIAAVFILIFVYTAVSKIGGFHKFRVVLAASPLMGHLAGALAVAVPAVELITSVLLFIPATRKKGLVASLALMVIFTIYIGYMFLFASHLPCSCGGIIQQLSWRQHLLFNSMLVILATTSLFQHKIFIAINRGSRKTVTE